MVARKSASDTSWPNVRRSSLSSITMRPLLIPPRRLKTALRAKRSMTGGRRARAASTPDATMESDLAISTLRLHRSRIGTQAQELAEAQAQARGLTARWRNPARVTADEGEKSCAQR